MDRARGRDAAFVNKRKRGKTFPECAELFNRTTTACGKRVGTLQRLAEVSAAARAVEPLGQPPAGSSSAPGNDTLHAARRAAKRSKYAEPTSPSQSQQQQQQQQPWQQQQQPWQQQQHPQQQQQQQASLTTPRAGKRARSSSSDVPPEERSKLSCHSISGSGSTNSGRGEDEDEDEDLAGRIEREFSVRPVWAEDALRVRMRMHMSRPISLAILRRFAHCSVGGVFDGLWIRHDYLPRDGRDSLAWQLIKMDCSQSLRSHLQALRVGPASPSRVCGGVLDSSGALRAQLCDIHDPTFQATLLGYAKASEKQGLRWHPDTGWLPADSYAHLCTFLHALAVKAVQQLQAQRASTR